jgi:hypothetical protein
MVAVGRGVMGEDWLTEVEHGGEKLSIILICSSIFLVNFSFHAMNSNRIFYILACTSTVK